MRPFNSGRTLGRFALLPVLIVLSSALPALGGQAQAATVRYLATTGSDAAAGTKSAPYRTLTKALGALRPGDTLIVRGGTYAERVTSVRLTAGKSSARIKVVAATGERPVLQGLLWLTGASYWDFRGLNVTWGSANRRSEHMLKFTGGTHWTFTDAEVWGAHSYAAILVVSPAAGWVIARNYIHDTYKSNGLNQDHLIYANGGGGGVIEHNRLVRSVNGRAVKVGPASSGGRIVDNLVIRYNTMMDNLGPSNVQITWRSSNVQIYRNIMVLPAAKRSAVTAYELSGNGNVVRDNVGWATPRLLDAGVRGLTDSGGNVLMDPKFTSDLRPTVSAAAAYGYLAARG